MRAPTSLPSAASMDVAGMALGVAHDLRNLLFVISTQLQRVSDRFPGDDPLRRELDAIRDTSDRASALTRYFLSCGRGAPAAPLWTDVNEVVRGMKRVLAQVAGPRIRVRTRLARRLWRVRVHATQIEQVLLNLVANARDAMPDGGTITISTANRRLRRAAKPEPDRVALMVRDTGAGMPQDIQAQIFDPFYTTKPGGTGIGLTTVRAIATIAGGDVGIESGAGEGTAVTVSLPKAEPLTVAATVPPQPVADEDLQSRRILLVDDEPSVRELLRQFLESRGFELTVAGNGMEALEALESGRPPDLLVTDFHLPDSIGPEVVRRIRERAPSMRVVFMSGAPDATAALERHGGDPVLTKPFSMKELDRAVRAAFGTAA